MISDPTADMLTRIRNAYQAGHQTVTIPYSIFKEEIAKVLLKNNYLKSVKKEGRKLMVALFYLKGKPAVSGIETVSKPGRRVYCRKDKLPYVLSGLGIAIISTNKGVMTAQEARKKGLGGEVIGKLW